MIFSSLDGSSGCAEVPAFPSVFLRYEFIMQSTLDGINPLFVEFIGARR